MIFMKRNVLIMDSALFGMCSKWNVPLNILFLECDQDIMYPFWNVIKMKHAQNRMCPFWNVLKTEFALFGMWSKWNGLKMECVLIGMWTKWNVLKKECDHLCSNVQLSERVIKINFISTFTQVSISSLNVDSLMDPNRDEQTFQSNT